MKRTETARLLGKTTQPIDERKACSAVMGFGLYSKSTILTGFVDYSGYVELKAVTESENESEKVLKNRKINIEYCGDEINMRYTTYLAKYLKTLNT